MRSSPRTFGFYNQQRRKWTLSRQSKYMPKWCSGDSFCRPNLTCAIISKGYICTHRWRMSHTDRAFTSCGNSIIPCCLKSMWLRANLNPSGGAYKMFEDLASVSPIILLISTVQFTMFNFLFLESTSISPTFRPVGMLFLCVWHVCIYYTSQILHTLLCWDDLSIVQVSPSEKPKLCQPLHSSPTVYPIFLPE